MIVQRILFSGRFISGAVQGLANAIKESICELRYVAVNKPNILLSLECKVFVSILVNCLKNIILIIGGSYEHAYLF
jgi:hypothetical protein